MKHLIACLSLCASPAIAQDYIAFQSPSGNIHCVIWGGEYAGARCDMMELTPSFSKAPADCDLDWGASFAVDPLGDRGYLACVGDTVADPSGLLLDYDQEISIVGITCVSQKSGMTCTNALGHGFTIAKAKQTLF